MQTYDSIVVGAGPAGSIFAALAKGQQILLLDGSYQNPKPCGGLLAPDTQKQFARFNITLPKDILADPQIFSVKTIDVPKKLIRYYRRMYINTDRQRFDNWLRARCGPHVTLVQGKCTAITPRDDGYQVAYTDANGVKRLGFTHMLVGADGANSIVRRSLFPPLKTRSYTAIQQWFAADKSTDDSFYICVFDPQITDCYSWGIHKDNQFVLGGAYPKKGCREAFEKQKKSLSAFGFAFDTPLKTEACQVLRPTGPASFCCGGKGVYLLGEAGGFISPSSLEGISYATQSAVHLYKSISKNPQNMLRSYQKRTRLMRLKLLLKNVKGQFMYRPFLRELVMRSGISAIALYQND